MINSSCAIAMCGSAFETLFFDQFESFEAFFSFHHFAKKTDRDDLQRNKLSKKKCQKTKREKNFLFLFFTAAAAVNRSEF